ncbi:hypothetical protein [Methylibium petroleiphilum]
MDATLEAESGQATLDGVVPEVQAPAPPVGEAFKLALVGKLLAPAYVHTTTHGDVQLVVLVEQSIPHHPQALPLLAAWTWPGDACLADRHERARARAARLPAGAEVLALGHGLECGHHQRQPVLRLLHCTGIDIPNFPTGAH